MDRFYTGPYDDDWREQRERLEDQRAEEQFERDREDAFEARRQQGVNAMKCSGPIGSLQEMLIAAFNHGVELMCDQLDIAQLNDMQLMDLWIQLPPEVRLPLRNARNARAEAAMKAERGNVIPMSRQTNQTN